MPEKIFYPVQKNELSHGVQGSALMLPALTGGTPASGPEAMRLGLPARKKGQWQDGAGPHTSTCREQGLYARCCHGPE